MSSRKWQDQKYFAYLLAIAGVILAAAIRYALGPSLGGTIPVVIFTVPVVLCSFYGGFWPGMFCTCLSALVSDYLFIEPINHFAIENEASAVVLFVFFLIGLSISSYGQKMKTMQSRLAAQTALLGEVNKELELANVRKDEFLAMLAHELRNPLAGISSAAELLKFARADQQRIAQAGALISRQVRHMTKLVDDILDVSRVTRGLVVIEKHPVDLREVVEEAVEQLRPAFESKNQYLRIDMPENHACVCGDHVRLTQIIGNLLGNSNRYSPAGGHVQVSLTIVQDQVVLSVKDDGQGIPAPLLPRIFDLFVQAERTRDRSHGGMGIGLALVKKLVELHEGTITATSDGPGMGSQFTVTLPHLKRQLPKRRAKASRPHVPVPAKPMHILVVDDDVDTANSLALLLQSYGHTTFVGYGAKEALDLAHAEELDAIFMDIGLPERDGRTLCEQMKTIPHLANTIFIAISGYGRRTDIELSEKAGFDCHLVKPVSPEAILDALTTRGKV